MSYPALTLDLKCSTLHLMWLGWSRVQLGLTNMSWRLQGHLKGVKRNLQRWCRQRDQWSRLIKTPSCSFSSSSMSQNSCKTSTSSTSLELESGKSTIWECHMCFNTCSCSKSFSPRWDWQSVAISLPAKKSCSHSTDVGGTALISFTIHARVG